MGVTTNGILCYGFPLGDEDDVAPSWLIDGDPEDENSEAMDFEDFLAKLHELPHPPGKWSDDEATKARLREYWDKKSKLVEEVGIELVEHCSEEYTMYVLAVTESVTTATRGSTIELGQAITTKQEWSEKLRAFCEKAGIEFKEPQFLLCSYWG